MKKILGILTMLLMLSFTAIGATATTDSVLIPRKWFVSATVDLKNYDRLKAEHELRMQELIETKSLVQVQQQKITLTLTQVKTLEDRLEEAKKIALAKEEAYSTENDRITKEYKKYRRAAKTRSLVGIATGVALGVVIGIIAK